MEFLPWSQKVLLNNLKKYKQTNQLCILDIQLGGACNYQCIYCDTVKYQCSIQYDLNDIMRLAKEGNVEWIFVCGLGEPTANKNISTFKQILTFCYDNGIRCSAFTNLANFDNELFMFVERKVLYPLFKLDSLDPKINNCIYGINNLNNAKLQLDKVKQLATYAQVEDECTNICASIVPSAKNKDYIKDVIKWCIENNIYPLIGDLEDAGKGQDEYKKLKLSDDVLTEYLKYIKFITNKDYRIPVCPSALFGIHISVEGYVIVDESTALSCHWFWLTEPKIRRICSIHNKSFRELSDSILSARIECRENVVNLLRKTEKMVFGGCGGDVVDLLDFYLKNVLDNH